jgi:hypothetical protein
MSWQPLSSVTFDLQQMSERNQHQHEKLILQVENTLLRIERRLPGGKSKN